MDLSSDDNFYAGAARDISVGGLYVESRQRVSHRHGSDRPSQAPGQGLSLRAEVMWSVGKGTKSFGMGLRFLNLPAPAKRDIEAFMLLRQPISFAVEDADEERLRGRLRFRPRARIASPSGGARASPASSLGSQRSGEGVVCLRAAMGVTRTLPLLSRIIQIPGMVASRPMGNRIGPRRAHSGPPAATNAGQRGSDEGRHTAQGRNHDAGHELAEVARLGAHLIRSIDWCGRRSGTSRYSLR